MPTRLNTEATDIRRVSVETAVTLSDLHIPYEDAAAVRAALELIEHLQPTTVFLNGDIIDFYSVSRFERDPARKFTLQEDLDKTRNFFGQLQRAAPQANLVFLPGNHEDRLRRYVLAHAEELAGLDDLRLENLLRLSDYGITLVNRNTVYKYHDLILTHGDRVRGRSGYTAHAMLDKYGVSGQSGHTHRAARVARTFLGRRVEWLEGGCLCSLNPEYVDTVSDWQQAVIVMHTADGATARDLVMISEGSLFYDGRIFDGNRAN